MAYFSNGSEGDMYENHYCRVCLHRPNYWRKSGTGGKESCPIMDLHSWWNYEQELNDEEKQKTDDKFIALNLLIPKTTITHKFADGREIQIPTAGECAFFIDEQKLIKKMKKRPSHDLPTR